MKKILSIAAFLLMEIVGVTVHAQQPARIAGEGSYLNIRQQPSSDSKIIGTFKAGELFYVEAEEDSWRKATGIYNKEGFVYSPRIELIDSLPDAQLQNLFNHVFENEKELAENFNATVNKFGISGKNFHDKADSLNCLSARKKLEQFGDKKYLPLVSIYPNYFYRTADTVTLQNLFDAVWADIGSADETPGYSLGQCFICDSALMKQQISYLPAEERKHIQTQDEFGLYNVYDVETYSTSANAEFNAFLLE